MYASQTLISKIVLLVCAFITILSCSSQTAVRAHTETQKSNASQVMELMREGSVYYLKHDFESAIGPYQKALDLEKKSAHWTMRFGRFLSTIWGCLTE